jgi:hypothetical protein
MQLRWVGDSRDYVKWDCVFENSEGRSVFYVPMLRSNVDSICKHSEVQRHFDQRKDLDQFEELFPGCFHLFSPQEEYSTKIAEEYFRSVIDRLKELQRKQKVLVFIDPDTGIEPRGGAKNEHLRCRDLHAVWNALQTGDKLMIYQHAPRVGNWKQHLKEYVADVLKPEPVSEPYFNEKLAKDACFLALEKSKS